MKRLAEVIGCTLIALGWMLAVAGILLRGWSLED